MRITQFPWKDMAKKKDIEKERKKLKFNLIRSGGKHDVWYKDGIGNVIVPRHREINELTAVAILKKANG